MMHAAVLFIKWKSRTRLNGQLIDLEGTHARDVSRMRDDANTREIRALCEMEFFQVIDLMREDRLCTCVRR